MIISKKNKVLYFSMLFLLAVFLILKTRRGFITVTDENGGIWNIIQGFFVMFGLYVLFSKESTYREFRFVKLYVAFMLSIWFLSFFVFLFIPNFNINTLFRFIVVPYGVMVVLAFYYIGLRCDIKKYPYILWIAFIVSFYLLFISMRNVYVLYADTGAVADVYYIVGLLPLIFIYTPPKYRMIPFFIASVAIMMTGKRTGFFMLGVILITYFLLGGDENSKKSLAKRLVAFVVVLVGTYFIITKLTGSFNLNMFDRLERLSEDGGSGRADRWAFIINAWAEEESVLPLLIGHGHGSVVKLVGGHAHNEFLEMLYDYGIFVLFIYIAVFVSYFREMVAMFKARFPYAKEFMVSFIVSIFLAMFSFYAIDCTHITCCSVSIGLILAEWYKFKYDIVYE